MRKLSTQGDATGRGGLFGGMWKKKHHEVDAKAKRAAKWESGSQTQLLISVLGYADYMVVNEISLGNDVTVKKC